jgi:hypothetical protein
MDFLNHDDASRGRGWIVSRKELCSADSHAEAMADGIVMQHQEGLCV